MMSESDKSHPKAAKPLSLAELIARTPGAQSREALRERINMRHQPPPKPAKPASACDDELGTPEPAPFLDRPDDFAAGFFARMKDKAKATHTDKPKTKPGKRSKPRIVVDNEKPQPPEKTE